MQFPALTLFLDFDGVICQSLEECFRTSWLTLTGQKIGLQPIPEPPFNEEYRRCFDACRPYIRSGEDYIVVHEWAASGRIPQNQDAFDQSLKARGVEAMAEWKKKLYVTREKLLVEYPQEWLSWNPLYPGIQEALQAQCGNPQVWILSTKKADFIHTILSFHGVDWSQERIIYTGTKRKLDWIDQLVGKNPAVLIDDQIDHLDFQHPTCDCWLALWGYVSSEACQKAPQALNLEDGLKLIRSFPPPSQGELKAPIRPL